MRYLDQLFDRGRFREADDVEIRSVDAQNRCCSTLYYSCVISTAGPIRRAHFAQLRAALLDHVGNAERTADLHQLSARDQHFAFRRNGGEQQQRRRGVVVREQRRLAAEERAADRLQVLIASAALALLEVELEIRVALGDRARALPQLWIDWRAAEVCVDDDAGSVDHPPQRGGR